MGEKKIVLMLSCAETQAICVQEPHDLQELSAGKMPLGLGSERLQNLEDSAAQDGVAALALFAQGRASGWCLECGKV